MSCVVPTPLKRRQCLQRTVLLRYEDKYLGTNHRVAWAIFLVLAALPYSLQCVVGEALLQVLPSPRPPRNPESMYHPGFA